MINFYAKEKFVCCEDCEAVIPADDAAPDGLCFECYADRLIDDTNESSIRTFLSYNRSDLVAFLRGNVYDH